MRAKNVNISKHCNALNISVFNLSVKRRAARLTLCYDVAGKRSTAVGIRGGGWPMRGLAGGGGGKKQITVCRFNLIKLETKCVIIQLQQTLSILIVFVQIENGNG